MTLEYLPTPPAMWAGREEPLSSDGTKMRQCKSGELCWGTAVLLLDICARSARIASRSNSLCGGDVYRINELVRSVMGGARSYGAQLRIVISPVADS